MAITATELEACYRRVERSLHNVLYRWLWDAQSCQDVMHDAFLRLWSRRERLQASRIDALVYTTALNLARNRLRWQRLRQWVGLEQTDVRMHPSAAGADDWLRSQMLREALQALSASDRNLLLLSEFGGFDTDELATMLGVAPGTVGARKHRAIARLKQRVGIEGERDG